VTYSHQARIRSHAALGEFAPVSARCRARTSQDGVEGVFRPRDRVSVVPRASREPALVEPGAWLIEASPRPVARDRARRITARAEEPPCRQ
jgi:hypothetical protein